MQTLRDARASDSASARILTNLSRLVLPPDPVTRTCPRHDQVEKHSTLVSKGHRFRGRFPGHAEANAPQDHSAAYLGAFGAVASSAQQSAYRTSARLPLSIFLKRNSEESKPDKEEKEKADREQEKEKRQREKK